MAAKRVAGSAATDIPVAQLALKWALGLLAILVGIALAALDWKTRERV